MKPFQMKAPIQHINRPAAAAGGNGMLGMLGGAIGGALLAPLGPLGMAVGSSIGSSLAGKGDLSGVTPEGVALGTLTAGIPMPGAADATKLATEGAKATATQAASQAATDAALTGATEAATTGVTEGLKGALSPQGATNLAGMAAPTIGEAAKPSFLKSIFSPDGLSNMAKDSAGGYIKNPNTVAELGINKLVGGLGRVKDSLFGAKAATLAGGGYVKNESMYSAKGGYAGKGCGCGPMANCNC
tara:strand:+ start:836 stop:1567 length:732 start_codon:yes stop_codon:yes gene_type:complete